MAAIKVRKQTEGAMSVSKEVSLGGQLEFGNILMAKHEMNSQNFIRYFKFFKNECKYGNHARFNLSLYWSEILFHSLYFQCFLRLRI